MRSTRGGISSIEEFFAMMFAEMEPKVDERPIAGKILYTVKQLKAMEKGHEALEAAEDEANLELNMEYMRLTKTDLSEDEINKQMEILKAEKVALLESQMAAYKAQVIDLQENHEDDLKSFAKISTGIVMNKPFASYLYETRPETNQNVYAPSIVASRMGLTALWDKDAAKADTDAKRQEILENGDSFVLGNPKP